MATRLLKIEKGAGVRLLSNLKDLRPVLKGIGAYLLGETDEAFQNERRGSKPWAARMAPNVPGIVRDLNAGKNPPGRRFDPGPVLRDTGRLKASFSSRISGKSKVIVGTTVHYAAIHQSGGVRNVTLTATGRGNLVEYLRENREHQKDLGWLFSQPSFMVKIRARPFLDITKEDEAEIVQLVEDYAAGG